MSDVVQEALKRLKSSVDYFGKQRKREKDDLAFQVPELQWEPEAQASRMAMDVDGVPVPARPMISIPKLDQPIQLVLNQEKAAHLGVNIHPISEDASDDTAETIQGLYRSIERDSRAYIARSWAFDRAVKAGMGAYRVNTVWDEDSDHPSDQKIVIQRLLYQEAAHFDPSAQEPDWCDGEWAFITSWVAFDTFKRLYPESELASIEDGELKALVEDAPEWVNLEGEKPAVLIAEYFRKSYTVETVNIGNGKTRERQVPTVLWSKINAVEELEPTQETNGKYIPLIPVIGRELQPFDSERRWVGIIGPAKGAARMFNYAASSAIELAALEPKAPYVMYDGQQEGHESMWQQANIRNFPYLLANPTMVDGKPAPLPQRTQADVGKLGPSMMLLEKADQFIQAATATFDPSLGNMPTKDRSGKAILALQQQSDAGNSHFLYNLAEISMTYEAKVVLDLLPKIYDRPGRVARILDGEDNSSAVLLNAPFTVDEKGRPRQVPQGATWDPRNPAPAGSPAPSPEMRVGNTLNLTPPKAAPKVRHYDLTVGTYGVSVSIGKSFQTRLQAGAETIGAILEGNPELMPLIGPTYFKFRDEPGMKEIAKILGKVRDKQYPGIDKDDDEQPDAAALQARVKQADEMMQMAQQEIAALKQTIETDKVKADAAMQKAELDNKTKAALQQMQDEADKRLQLMEERFALMLEERKHEHAMELDAQKAQHAKDAADRQALHGVIAGEQSHGHTLEAQAQKPQHRAGA